MWWVVKGFLIEKSNDENKNHKKLDAWRLTLDATILAKLTESWSCVAKNDIMLNLNSKYSYLTIAAVLFLASTGNFVASANDGTCEATGSCSGLLNSAFVFIKPHANTPKTQALVKEALTKAGITILSESEISGETIDKDKLIDQHYFASKKRHFLVSPLFLLYL